MIHYLVSFSDNPENSALADELRVSGVAHKLIGRRIVLRYRHRIQLLLFGLPRLAFSSVVSAWNSLFRYDTPPTVVIVGTHFQALAFCLLRLFSSKKPKIVLLGFIFTPRSHKLLRMIRSFYFTSLFRSIELVICYSSLEVERYVGLFGTPRDRFAYIPYGLHVHGYELSLQTTAIASNVTVSAGRSGRDYSLLTKVFAQNGYPLRIICDSLSAQHDCVTAPNIEWLTNCFDEAYFHQLKLAAVVVVPLRESDISAGQMVILQAMALARPIIATRVKALQDYVGDQSGVILVSSGSETELAKAVDFVLGNPEVAQKMARDSHAHYTRNHSVKVFVRNLLSTVARIG